MNKRSILGMAFFLVVVSLAVLGPASAWADSGPSPLPAFIDNATALNPTQNLDVQAGTSIRYQIAYRNTGESTWTSSLGYGLNQVNCQQLFCVVHQLSLPTTVAPGAIATWEVSFYAGSAPGLMSYQYGLVHNGQRYGQSSTVTLHVVTCINRC